MEALAEIPLQAPVPCKGHIAVVDGNSGGHHLTYMRMITKALLEDGWQVSAFLPDPQGLETWLAQHAKHPAGRFRASVMVAQKPKPRIWRLWWLTVPIEAWFAMARTLRRPGMTYSLVVVAFLDDAIEWATPFFRGILPLVFPWRWVGFYFQPWHLRLPQLERDPFQSGEQALHSRRCAGVALVDKGSVPLLARRVPCPVHYIPDATDVSLPTVQPQVVRCAMTAAAGRRIILLTGKLARRKGVLGFLQTAAASVGRPWLFVIAGELKRNVRGTYSPEERVWLDAVQQHPPPNLLVIPGRIENECDLNALIAASDVVYAVYDQWANSSGILTKAGCFGKPALVEDHYCMSEVVKEYGIGISIAEDNAEQRANAIQQLLDRPPEAHQILTFRNAFGYEAFARSLVNMVSSVTTVPRGAPDAVSPLTDA